MKKSFKAEDLNDDDETKDNDSSQDEQETENEVTLTAEMSKYLDEIDIDKMIKLMTNHMTSKAPRTKMEKLFPTDEQFLKGNEILEEIPEGLMKILADSVLRERKKVQAKTLFEILSIPTTAESLKEVQTLDPGKESRAAYDEVLEKLSLGIILDRATDEESAEQTIVYFIFLKHLVTVNQGIGKRIMKMRQFWKQIEILLLFLIQLPQDELIEKTFAHVMSFVYKLTLILDPKHKSKILETMILFLVFIQYDRQVGPKYLDDLGDLVEGFFSLNKEKNQKVAQRLRELGIFQFAHFFSETVMRNVKHAEMGEELEENFEKEKIRKIMRKREDIFRNGKDCCAVCRAGGKLKRCSRCEGILYCSRKCQREDWARHKPLCKKALK